MSRLFFFCSSSVIFQFLSRSFQRFLFTSSSFAAYFMRYTIPMVFGVCLHDRVESMFKAFERCCLHKSMYTVLYIHRSYFSSLSRDKNVVLVLSLSNDRTRDERTFKRRTFYECIIISGKSIETRFTFMVFHLCSSFGRASALKENRFSRTLAHIGIFVIQMQTTKVQPTQAIVSFFFAFRSYKIAFSLHLLLVIKTKICILNTHRNEEKKSIHTEYNARDSNLRQEFHNKNK